MAGAAMAELLRQSGASGLFLMSETHGGRLSRAAEHAPPALRETIDLADRGELFAKHRCVARPSRVRPEDAAEIRYAAPSGVPPTSETILHRDLAAALRAAHDRAGDTDDPTPAGAVALTA